MGDDDRRPAFEQPVERLLDQHLGRAVDVRGRLVEDEDPRVGEQRPRDRDQLALAGRQARAALAHRVVEAARQPRGHAVDADCRGGGLDLLVGRVRLGEADVRGDRAAEEERILEHDAELAPIRVEIDVAHVVAVDTYRSLVGVVMAADQPRESRLPVARLTHEREAAARRNVERDTAQHGILAVCEPEAVELEVAFDPRQRQSVGPAVDVGLLVEDARDLDHRRSGRLQLPVHVRKLLEGLEHERQDVRRRDQRADRQRPVLVEVRAEVDDGPRRQHAEEFDRGEEDREDLLDVRRLGAVGLVQGVELGLEVTLAVECLHDRHPGYRFCDLSRDRRDPVPLLDICDVRGALEPAGKDDGRRKNDERDQAETPVGDDQRDHRRRQEDQVRDERRHPLRERVRDRVDVARQARDDPARLLL